MMQGHMNIVFLIDTCLENLYNNNLLAGLIFIEIVNLLLVGYRSSKSIVLALSMNYIIRDHN